MPRISLARLSTALLLALVLMPGACRSTQQASQVQAREPLIPGGLTPSEVDVKLKSFGDSFVSLTAQASDELAQSGDTPELRSAAHRLKLTMAHAAFTIAASRSPLAGLIDMAVMVTLERHAVEEFWNPVVFDGRAEPLVEALRKCEADIRVIMVETFGEEPLAELDRRIGMWRERHPTQVYVSHIRFGDFAEIQGARVETAKGGRRNLLSLFMIDPLAGLDPTVREIEQTRQLAERLFYFLSRSQILIGWQVEGVALDLATFPETQSVLADTRSFSMTGERFATTAEGLPAAMQEIITSERAALIEQIDGVMTAQRQGLMQDLRSEGPVVEGVLGELRQTLEAGEALSVSLNATLETVKAMSPLPEPNAQPKPPGRPFNPQEYEALAAETTETVRELTVLVDALQGLVASEALDARIAKLDLAVGRVETGTRRLINHAFLLAAGLVVLIFVASLVKLAVARGRPTMPTER